MPRSKEISEEVRKKVVEAHKDGKGYKTISKVFDLHRSTVRQIIYKWKVFNTIDTRPRSGRPTKLDTVLRKVMRSDAGADTRPGSGVQDDVGASVNPLRASDPALTRTRRIRSHKEKREEAELRRNHALASPPTRSSSRAPTIPRYEAPALRPAEHHVEVILCCEICGACFPTETDLESHQAEHLHETLHECEECGKAFQSAAGLKTHKKRKHGC